MSIQSLMTPAMFIVNALVLPINKNTARLSAKAHDAFNTNIGQSKTSETSAIIFGPSMKTNGNARKNAHAGET